jgi:Domain of unknown function (DUF4421)
MLKASRIVTFLVAAILASTSLAFGQKKNVFLHPDLFYKKFFPKLNIKRPPVDSSFIKSYPNLLSVGTHITSPDIGFDLVSKSQSSLGKKSSSYFRTQIPDILGFVVNYRFVSAGFAFLIPDQQRNKDYVVSSYHTATIKYNSPAYTLQFKYLKIKGLTDVNTSNSADGLHFVRRPDIAVKQFQFDGIHNFGWKKYSYIAPATFAQRQLKSWGGFMLKGGVYYTKLSADSGVIGKKQQPNYDSGFGSTRAIKSLSVRVAPGIGGNLVFFKRLYLSAAVFGSYDLYNYQYYNTENEPTTRGHSWAPAISGLSSVGFQSSRFYAALKYEIEKIHGPSISADVNSLFSYFGAEVGYRFVAPKAIKSFYKKTMPPGM